MQDRRELITAVPSAETKTEVQRQFEPKQPVAAVVAESYGNYRGSVTASDEAANFADYWRAIRKRLWLVITLVVLVMTLTAIYMARRPDEFLAHARVQVDPPQKNEDLLISDRRGIPNVSDPIYFNTQLQNLLSPILLRRVVKEINLEQNKDFKTSRAESANGGLNGLLRAVGLSSDAKKKTDETSVPVSTSSSVTDGEDLAEAKRLQPWVETLQKNLLVEPVRESRVANKETRLIEISYTHTNPELAALIVNTVADVFVKRNAELKTGTNAKTNEYLKTRIADLQTEVKADEELLAKLKRDSGTLSLNQDKTLALSQLEILNDQNLKAQEALKNADAKLKAADKPETLQLLMQSTLARKFIDDTKFEINRLQQERTKQLEEFQESAPEIKMLDREIKSRQEALDNYGKNAVSVLKEQLKTDYEAAQRQAAQTEAAYRAAFAKAQAQNDAGINIKLVEQRLKVKKETLDDLQKNARGNDIAAAGTENNIFIADIAVTPDQPIGPRRLLSVLISGFLAGLFGCGLALFLEYLDDSVKTPEDVENILRLPALAVIPAIDSVKRAKLLAVGGRNDSESVALAELPGNRAQEVLITNDTRSALAEAYRQLRTSILLSTAGHAPKSLLITSSVPSEGKTTTAVNTAISLAQTGAKVVIVDADMRRPRLHSIFGISNAQGLSSILSSKFSDNEILGIVQRDAATNLYLLPSGAVPPNPAELIGSPQMQSLLRLLEDEFTHVVIDSPPIASFTDGVLIANMVDGVLLVVHSGKSSRQIVKRAKQLLQDVGAKILGVVLNNVNIRSSDNSYYYQNYYNSYYKDAD
jgi:succinoglycan biosynthesis transport protein ExoP